MCVLHKAMKKWYILLRTAGRRYIINKILEKHQLELANNLD